LAIHQNQKTTSEEVVCFIDFGGAKGDNEIMINFTDEANSTKQIAAVDFDAVLVR